ncbi:hypothetical protein Vadar_032257 [Vaccinium darrowii]|uniref:Uncharacterized protein n=1 Tax=Vaccinium darrowii TaxID=229202 RepID=A0ACB7Z8A7_9ERIC|nr:hypothetical protein Vadar_032257 [Vaccinium darrowii]
MSPRDDDGHGTHVASTAAGTGVANANTFGFASGTARGIASKARIAMYKACWPDCFWSDVFAGMEAAIKDGVDILSVSIGFPEQPYYENLMARAAFAAVKKNIFICCSAGNDGPGMSSVHNAAPWITTVGSGSMDRSFPVQIQIGDKSFVGSSLYPGKIINKSYPLVNPGSCGFEKTVPNNVGGKIVVCSYGGVTDSFEDGKLIHEAGGVGMIALHSIFDGEEIRAVPYTLPSVTLGYKGGLEILSYINSTRNPSVSFRIHNITVVGKDRAPIASSMSSRGPNPIAPEILKPDIIAPGSNILAAWPPNVAPTASPHDRRRVKFNILSGTSMACPHVAGVAALLRAAHPNWSPSAIRSALMTTATTIDNEDAPLARYDDMGQATPLSIGAGHINPQMASDPGLVYDADTSDYTKFLCSLNYTEKQMKAFVDAPNSCTGHAGAPGDLNYPSFSVVFKGNSTIQELKRTATNVGELLPEIYKVRVINFEAEKLTVSVKPQSLVFKKLDEKQSYIVNFKSNYSVDKSVGVVKQMVFGSILWESDRHSVRSPFAVMWQ